MVQSKAVTVDDWFQEVEPQREAVLRAVRQVALAHFGAATERMSYGMPAYQRPGDASPVFAFKSQKQYVSLYVSPRVHALHEAALKGLDAGKSCIRFKKPDQIDLDLLGRMLADSAKLPAVV